MPEDVTRYKKTRFLGAKVRIFALVSFYPNLYLYPSLYPHLKKKSTFTLNFLL